VSRIACQGISKSFGTARVITDLDLEVPDGAIVVILGESGSGKTTLLRMIAGFDRPDHGTISIDEEIVDSARQFVPPEKRRIGYVAQEGNLFPHLTVAKNVAFGMPRGQRRTGRVEALLELVGLSQLGARYPHQLSGGQQQRVALARALAPDPKVVLLDEPFSSLDASLRASLRIDVTRILRDQQATTILVTHDQSEALSVADFVGIIHAGRIRQIARPEVLYEHPVDRTVAEFLGDANIVAGDASGGAVSTPLGRLELAQPDRGLRGACLVLVRPEQVSLQPLGEGLPAPAAVPGPGPVAGPGPTAALVPGPDYASGQVVHREYYGHDCVVLVDLNGNGRQIRVRCPGRPPVEIGDRVTIRAHGDVTAWPAPDAEQA
jgi:iron(III) transport system ATP-binding protein